MKDLLSPSAGECELFGDFGVFIQAVLGVASIGTLLSIDEYLY
jgi:hypothetical protein